MIQLLILLTLATFKIGICGLADIEIKDNAAITSYQCSYRIGDNPRIMEVKIVHHFAEFLLLPMQYNMELSV